MHQSSLENMRRFQSRYLNSRKGESLDILDLGSMDINGSYRFLFENPNWRYQGMDMAPGPNVDIVLKTPYHWQEVPSESADVFISGQAFEHIEFFWITALEIARVLKPGGLCCLIAPSGGFEHRYPVDCWRFYPDGFRALARFARLDVLAIKTQKEPLSHYTDNSNEWKDSVLICQKPKLAPYYTWRQRLRRFVLHRILLLGL